MKKLFSALLFISSISFASTPQKTSFKAADGVSLNAIFAKPGENKPVVIMLHGLSSVKEEWNPLIEELSKKDIGALAYDARPAGTPWNKLVDDVGAAVRFLEARSIPRSRIYLAGASLGANVCIKYSALTGVGKKLILLSPGLNYQGLETQEAMKKCNADVLIVANPADGYAYQSSLTLIPLVKNGGFWTSQKPGHGVQMFDPSLLNKLGLWIETK